MSKLGKRALKAYVSAGIAAAGALGLGLAPNEAGDVVLTAQECAGAVGTALAAFASVYFVPNGADDDPTTSTPDEGLAVDDQYPPAF